MSMLSKRFSTDQNESNYITTFIVGDRKVINENLLNEYRRSWKRKQ
jgi:hypothetical protein